jgi:hypothetical protein
VPGERGGVRAFGHGPATSPPQARCGSAC